MTKPRKTRTYAEYDGREKVYIGESDDLARRAQEHKKEGHKFTRIVPTSRAMTKEGAQRKEADQLEAFRRSHGGRIPRYNEAPEG